MRIDGVRMVVVVSALTGGALAFTHPRTLRWVPNLTGTHWDSPSSSSGFSAHLGLTNINTQSGADTINIGSLAPGTSGIVDGIQGA